MFCYVLKILLQETKLVNRFTEATAENTQRQKQMGLAKNLISQVRIQVMNFKTFFYISYMTCSLYHKLSTKLTATTSQNN